MPRYNSSSASASISGAGTIGSPYSGAFTEFTGTAPYTVTVPSPVLYPGQNQTFYNNTSGTVTLSTPVGVFTGTGGNGTNSVSCYAGNVVSITSDGTNYIVISEDGSALVATTGTFSSNLSVTGGTTALTPSSFTLTPAGTGNIDNVIIGASTRQAGSFTNLAANAQTTLTANVSSSNTSTGTLVVTGGVGVSGTLNATALSASSITGTLQTAAQPNITSVGDLTSLTAAQSAVTYNTYSIPTATNVIVSPTLTVGYAYKIQLVTTGTGTITGAVYIVRNQSGTWQVFNVSNNGTSSNHPLLSISGTDLLVYHGHPSTYNVSVRVTSYYTGNTSGGLAGTFFGTDALLQNLGGNLNVPSASVAIGTSNAPTATLDVRGGIAVSGWSNNNGGSAGGVELGWDGTQALMQSYNRVANAYTPATINGSIVKLLASGNNIVTVNTTGLGINTTPSFPLHVSGGKVWFNNASGDTGTRAIGLTVSVNPGATYSVGSDPGDTARALSIISGTSASYPAILAFRNITAGTTLQMVDQILDPNTNKFYIAKPGTTPWLSISNNTHDISTSRGFRNWTKTHSTTNTSAGSGSPTTTNITQISDNMYEYGFYFAAGTGGYPTCPNSYWVMCPVQKQNTGSLAWAEVTIRGVHRGMWGANGYDEYATIVVGTGSDGGGLWVKEWKNGEANNSSNRIRVGWMNYDGVYNEGSNYNTGYNLANITGNNIGNSYYKMPLFLKIYTNCGADKEYQVTVRTNNPDALGPPFKGPMWLAPNTNPTSSIYW